MGLAATSTVPDTLQGSLSPFGTVGQSQQSGKWKMRMSSVIDSIDYSIQKKKVIVLSDSNGPESAITSQRPDEVHKDCDA